MKPTFSKFILEGDDDNIIMWESAKPSKCKDKNIFFIVLN